MILAECKVQGIRGIVVKSNTGHITIFTEEDKFFGIDKGHYIFVERNYKYDVGKLLGRLKTTLSHYPIEIQELCIQEYKNNLSKIK